MAEQYTPGDHVTILPSGEKVIVEREGELGDLPS
jgi:hypothetical protein